MKKVIIIASVSLIAVSGLFAYLYLSVPQQRTAIKKCGDGVCDALEKAKPALCPSDCQIQEQEEGKEVARDTTTTEKEVVREAPEPLPVKEADSPFAMHEVRFYDPKEAGYMKDLGAKSARIAPFGSLVWDLIEKEKGKYDWAATDRVMGEASKNGIKVFATVGPANKLDRPELAGGAPIMIPKNMDWYLSFLEAAAERYDGDGKEDAPGSIKIDVFQIYNEVDGTFWKDTPENYALLLKESYKTIKKVSDIKVAIAGTATPRGYYTFYRPMLEELDKIKDNKDDRYFDIFDLHWSGQFLGDNDYIEIDLGQKYPLRSYLSDIKSDLGKIGYADIPFYITEMSDYSDAPLFTKNIPYTTHSEAYHAAAVVKRFVYSLASGIDKIFWAQILEQHNFGGLENGYFDNVGLINNPRNSDGKSHKKLAYYTYKKMVEVLEGSHWDNIQIVQEKGGVYAYKFTKDKKSIWVAWNDNDQQKEVTLSGISSRTMKITDAVPKYKTGNEVVSYDQAFNSEIRSIKDSSTSVILKDKPLFIEEL